MRVVTLLKIREAEVFLLSLTLPAKRETFLGRPGLEELERWKERKGVSKEVR